MKLTEEDRRFVLRAFVGLTVFTGASGALAVLFGEMLAFTVGACLAGFCVCVLLALLTEQSQFPLVFFWFVILHILPTILEKVRGVLKKATRWIAKRKKRSCNRRCCRTGQSRL